MCIRDRVSTQSTGGLFMFTRNTRVAYGVRGITFRYVRHKQDVRYYMERKTSRRTLKKTDLLDKAKLDSAVSGINQQRQRLIQQRIKKLTLQVAKIEKKKEDKIERETMVDEQILQAYVELKEEQRLGFPVILPPLTQHEIFALTHEFNDVFMNVK
eukprot:TRINITY_DN10306_c0_g1_i1.p1 TRINITY_DN10306_c0_g1~~TRINITY_DN10306_c0_g1_i1.p1  ORF type:complete len:156 (-),score=12.99 TRINITY_DN10306_c0_g1_i1:178-645(-)